MDQYLNNRQNEILWNLLANPANNGYSYIENLQQLVNDFPHSGILHALLSHAGSSQNSNHTAAYLDPKALYVLMNSPENLALLADNQIIQHLSDTANYGTIEQVEVQAPQFNHLNNTIEQEQHITAEAIADESIHTSFNADTHEDQIYLENEARIDEESSPENESTDIVEQAHDIAAVEQVALPVTESVPEDERVAHDTPFEEETPLFSEGLVEFPADEPEESYEEVKKESEPVAENMPEHEWVSHTVPVEEDEPQVTVNQITIDAEEQDAVEVQDEEHKESETPGENVRKDELLTETPVFELAEPPRGIDDDIYDEIVGIENISFAQAASPEMEMPQTEETSYIEEEEQPTPTTNEGVAETIVQKERELDMNDEAEKLIVGNIAATDYFAFDRAFNDRKQAEPVESEPLITASASENGTAHIETSPTEEKKDVSKYNDDTLPYTFMWWLNKTRKEHAGIYQPFKLDTTQAIRQHGADELQQQYFENIFHLNAFEELDRSTPAQPVEFDMKTKEDRIIKRFIVEEPHIGTPSSDKLDTENKAKKSSEDQNEFVTETLARIYTDQMLYHKAINAYKKLMLKFPEKSRYFADQIEELERKSN